MNALEKIIYLLFIYLVLVTNSESIYGQNQYKLVTVGFYNLENLFDTEDDPKINDEEFLPNGSYAWTKDKYEEKLANMAYVISQLGVESAPQGLSLLGVSEIENRGVLEDLAKQPLIKDRNYQIIHYDSPDLRGIDVALLYNPIHFKPISSKPVFLNIKGEGGERQFTRDILFVHGVLDGDTVSVLVNHWPSRSGGEEASAYKRVLAAKLCRSLVDSLYDANPGFKIIIMGDLNDDPTSPSIKNHLRAKGKKDEVETRDVFNPMFDLYRRGFGSNAYRDAWSLFDQIIISAPFLNTDDSGYQYYKTNIFNKQFLIQASGQYKGYPFRTFSGSTYQGGYSDHYPVLIYLTKKVG